MLDKWDGTGSLAARTSVFSGRQKIEKSRDGSLHQGITACLDVQVYLDRLSVMLVPSYMDYGYTNYMYFTACWELTNMALRACW